MGGRPQLVSDDELPAVLSEEEAAFVEKFQSASDREFDSYTYRETVIAAGQYCEERGGTETLSQKAYARFLPEVDAYVIPFEEQGVNSATYIDVDRDNIYQLPSQSSYEEDRAEVDAMLQNQEYFEEYGLPQATEWEGVEAVIDGQRTAFTAGEYNPHLADYEELTPEEQERFAETGHPIAETVIQLIEDGHVSYAEGTRVWEQSPLTGHLKFDRERGTAVITDMGER